MWISELGERTGLPVHTIKHYLRIGVLPRGVPVGPVRAEYDESHVERLRLIRALHDVGKLSLEQVRQVFASVDASQDSLRDAVGEAHRLLSAELASREASPASLERAEGLVERRGWDVGDSTHVRALAVVLDTVESVDTGLVDGATERLLEVYADHADQLAVEELGHVDDTDRQRMLNSVVASTVLFEPLLNLVRRLAQEHVSHTWWAEERWRELPTEPPAQA